MNTKLATTQIRLTEWASIIKECKSSGLKVDEYCQQHNLSRDAYYYWLRKLKESALQQAGFVELPAPGKESIPSSDFHTQLVIKTAGIEIDINNDTPAELIARVLGVMDHAE